MDSWLTCMKKYAVFSGRARRTEYWTFTLINTIVLILAMLLDNMLGTKSKESNSGLFQGLYSLVTILPSVAVHVRRLHDVGKSGWWMLIGLVPVVGAIYLFVLSVTDSQAGDNEYGPNPKLTT